MNTITTGTCALVLALLGWGEAEHWRASKRRLGSAAPGHGTSEAVVVLGFRNRGNRINAVNRWRVRAGLRSLDRAEGRLVLSGGPAGGDRPEAELMANYARGICRYRGELLVETESRSTWENVRNVIPLIEDADSIKIVSHSLHAEKARAYLWRQRPDLATRLVRARDYRLGEWILVKPALALLGLRNLRRMARSSVG
ncbi:YdcF family protein [Spongiactinospora sp. 9N601]|uniref:YdcF family protein n=1 Tax=Spongiactinospora sp. 9N601 TaxID=3375149 RepID=UPI0037A91807